MNHKIIGNVFCVLNPIGLRGIIGWWPTNPFYTEQKILTLFEIRIHNICYRVGKKTKQSLLPCRKKNLCYHVEKKNNLCYRAPAAPCPNKTAPITADRLNRAIISRDWLEWVFVGEPGLVQPIVNDLKLGKWGCWCWNAWTLHPQHPPPTISPTHLKPLSKVLGASYCSSKIKERTLSEVARIFHSFVLLMR